MKDLLTGLLTRRWRPRRSSGHSRFVGLMKLLLPTLAVGLIAVVALWSELAGSESRFRIGLAQLAPASIDELSMANPRFEGIDERNRPFSLTAEQATQPDPKVGVIELTQPKADITLEGGAWVALTADTGRYRRDSDLLDLTGSVNLFHDEGYEFQATSMQIDLKDRSVVSETPVHGQGPYGELQAEGVRVTGNGSVVEFTGRSRMVINTAAWEARQ